MTRYVPQTSPVMSNYLAAALIIGLAVGPASAGSIGVSAGVSGGPNGLSAGVGANVGGVGVGAGVTAGPQGLSAGTGIGTGGVGGPSVGGSVSTGKASPSVSGSLGSSSLPRSLRPVIVKRGDTMRVTGPFGPLESLKTIPGTPPAVVSACRAAILSAAKALGAVRVFAVSAGTLNQDQGVLTAPIRVRIDYANKGIVQTRQARVSCTIDAEGTVTKVV